MELVDGVPITRYSDAKCLTVEQRIALFIRSVRRFNIATRRASSTATQAIKLRSRSERESRSPR